MSKENAGVKRRRQTGWDDFDLNFLSCRQRARVTHEWEDARWPDISVVHKGALTAVVTEVLSDAAVEESVAASRISTRNTLSPHNYWGQCGHSGK